MGAWNVQPRPPVVCRNVRAGVSIAGYPRDGLDASFVQEGRSETRRDAATIGGAAAGGAVLGRILNKGNRSRGSVLGAIIGAAAGTAIASKTPGEEVIIPEGSVVGLRLDDSVRVRVRVQTTASR